MTLRVWLNDDPVGTLRVDHAGWVHFDVAEDYWERDARPVIGQALENDRGKRVTRAHLTLPPMFSNLLPEGELRRLIAEHHGLDPRRELPLLARLGEDLPGALTFLDDASEAGPPAKLSVVNDDDAWSFSSLAGIQPKFTTEEDGKGLVLAAKGLGERWIVKVPDTRFRFVPETEELVTRWARAAGITTVEARLVPRSAIRGLPAWVASQDVMCFASKRYDRAKGARVHQEDFCQVLNAPPAVRNSAATYDTVTRQVLDLCGPEDAREMVRRLAFMVVSGNTDLHLKNWSLFYPERTRPRLAPAYDLVSTIPFIPRQATVLALQRTRELADYSLETFKGLAGKLGPLCDQVEPIVRETVQRAMAAWSDYLRGELEPSYAEAIDALHARLRLVREV